MKYLTITLLLFFAVPVIGQDAPIHKGESAQPTKTDTVSVKVLCEEDIKACIPPEYCKRIYIDTRGLEQTWEYKSLPQQNHGTLMDLHGWVLVTRRFIGDVNGCYELNPLINSEN